MCLYLCTKFQVSRIILMSFRQGRVIFFYPTSKWILEKSTQIRLKNLFEHEKEETVDKPVWAKIFWSNRYIDYESNGHRNKILSVEEHLNKIRPYLKDITNNLKKSRRQKIQLIIANKFISSIFKKW